TVAITHHCQRGESEDTAALDGLSNTINLHQLLGVAIALGIVTVTAIALLLVICHNLELQPAFTSSIGQRFHTAVVLEARTIECNLGDASGFCTLGNQQTDLLGRFNVASGTATQVFF